MNLGYAIASALRRMAVVLGFVSVVNVGFQPLETEMHGETLHVSAQLEGAVTEEVRALIDGASAVEIRYVVSELDRDGEQREYVVIKRIALDTLAEEYRVTRMAGGDASSDAVVLSSTRFEHARSELTRLEYRTERPGLSAVVVKARLQVPGVRDDSLVESLWAGQTPTAAVRLPENEEGQ